MERNIKMTVAYDGTSYIGWQRQPASQGISIQQRLEEAVSFVLGHPVTIHGAGRTDAGVHAIGQITNFSCTKPLPIEKMAKVINNLLPPDIRVMEAVEVAHSFHARFTPHTKRYRYLLEQGCRCSPFAAHYSWQVPGPLNLNAMRQSAQVLLGEHDFRYYTLSGVSTKNFVRKIYHLDIYTPNQPQCPLFPWQELRAPLVIDVTGNGFLYKMVRLIVCRLVAVGQGRLPDQAISAFLHGELKENIPPAPSQGLFLEKIWYE